MLAIEVSVEMRPTTAWAGQVSGVRSLLLSQAVALSSCACSVLDLGRREHVEGTDRVGDCDIVFALVRVLGEFVVFAGVEVEIVGGYRDDMGTNEAVRFLQKNLGSFAAWSSFTQSVARGCHVRVFAQVGKHEYNLSRRSNSHMPIRYDGIIACSATSSHARLLKIDCS